METDLYIIHSSCGVFCILYVLHEYIRAILLSFAHSKMDPSEQIIGRPIRRSDCNTLHIPDDLFKSLSLCRKALLNYILWDEYLILDRLCYKNQNQHRSADYFRKMKHVIIGC